MRGLSAIVHELSEHSSRYPRGSAACRPQSSSEPSPSMYARDALRLSRTDAGSTPHYWSGLHQCGQRPLPVSSISRCRFQPLVCVRGLYFQPSQTDGLARIREYIRQRPGTDRLSMLDSTLRDYCGQDDALCRSLAYDLGLSGVSTQSAQRYDRASTPSRSFGAARLAVEQQCVVFPLITSLCALVCVQYIAPGADDQQRRPPMPTCQREGCTNEARTGRSKTKGRYCSKSCNAQ